MKHAVAIPPPADAASLTAIGQRLRVHSDELRRTSDRIAAELAKAIAEPHHRSDRWIP